LVDDNVDAAERRLGFVTGGKLNASSWWPADRRRVRFSKGGV